MKQNSPNNPNSPNNKTHTSPSYSANRSIRLVLKDSIGWSYWGADYVMEPDDSKATTNGYSAKVIRTGAHRKQVGRVTIFADGYIAKWSKANLRMKRLIEARNRNIGYGE